MEKVSLILTTYNSGENLKKTLESIENQDYPEIEVVIKDGGSKDQTLELIKQYKKNSKYSVVWDSRKDTGIYDAMNQGYKMSSGNIIGFFNDVFSNPHVISKLVKTWNKYERETGDRYAGIHADLVYVEGEKVIRKWHMGEGSIYHGWMPGHPTLFLRRDIYERYGLYNTEFKIAADYEFMIRFLKDGQNKLAYLPENIINMFYGGTSSGGFKSYLISLVEGHKALKINKIPFAVYVDFRRTIKVLLQFISR